ncbi:pilus assembly protein [Arthrobacter sp. FW305-BF8]|uniref:TadE family type IV pilus minor pilin n=1 Tax=Arthrobacter sp. FW305-BF8 TaxID=2879617 RepID=UPI001F24D52C|nr:TadE family type IV pilus minor pilin [Arthrobacter sp. FW305-BF8]UKA53692.1 pilus assembly protein [Arthrobacter sp. FW305-BF8]
MTPAPQTPQAAGLVSCRQHRNATGDEAGSRGQGKARGAESDHGNSRGAVTAEFAVALPAVLLLLAMLLAGSAAGITQLRLEDAARAAARALARGEDPAAVDGIVRKLAGPSASAAVVPGGEWMSVTVSDRAAGPVGRMVPWTLTARAEARSEAASSAPAPKTVQAVRAAPAELGYGLPAGRPL